MGRAVVATLAVVAAGARLTSAQTIVAGPATTELQGVAGERLTMPIAVDLTGAPGTKLGAYRLSVRWKPLLLKFVTTGGAAFAAPVFNTDSAAQGVVKWAAANASGATGFFTLGSITLEVLTTAQADTLKLAFQELVAAETYTDLLPQLTLTTGVFCGGPVWGDLDVNGIVQSLDAQIVLMHAVGLPVTADTTRGDVDADTRVNPRDALIILSRVVGLDVTAFRVGKFVVSTCAGLPPASVTIFPEPIGMAVGDRFTARAEVKDGLGKIVLGKALAWSSSNVAVATVDSTGTLTAVTNGTAILTAAAAPGLTDTTTITVGDRHRWVVNAPGAQGQPAELGSDLYPFSTIKQGLDRAVDGDTVQIRYGRYAEPLSTTKKLVILGDSVATGYPQIFTPDSAAGVITRAGRQVLRQLHFIGSKTGLMLRVDTADLRSLAFTDIGGPALQIFGAERVDLRGIGVSGARGAGIWVDSTGSGWVEIRQALVTGIEPVETPLRVGPEYALHGVGIFAEADSVSVDSAEVHGVSGSEASDSAVVAAIFTNKARRTLVQRVAITDVGWRGAAELAAEEDFDAIAIAADTAVTLEVRNASLHRIAGAGLGMRGDTMRLLGAEVGELAEVVQQGDVLTEMTDVIGGGVDHIASSDGGLRFVARRINVDPVRQSAFDPGADTVTLDSVDVRIVDTSGLSCGLELSGNTLVAMVNYARFRNPGFGFAVCSRDPVTTGDSAYHHAGYVSIRNTVMDGAYTAVHVHADSLRLENDSIRAVGWGVWQHPDSVRPTQWLKVRDVRIHGLLNQGIYVDSVAGQVEIVRAEIDSTHAGAIDGGCEYECSAAIEVYDAGAVRIDSVNFHDNYRGALEVWTAASLRAYGNAVTGSYFQQTFYYETELPPALLADDVRSVLIRKNLLDEVDNSGILVTNANGDTVTVDSNTVRTRRATISYYAGHGVYGALVRGGSAVPVDTSQDGRVVIRDNSFKGTRRPYPYYGVGDNTVVIENLAGVGVVEGNAIDSTGRAGVRVIFTDTALVNFNTVTNAPPDTVLALNAYGLRFGQANGNTVTCAGSGVNEFGVTVGTGNGEAIGNVVSRCGRGVRFFDNVHGTGVVHTDGQGVLRANAVTRDGGRLGLGVFVTGRSPPRVVLVGNTVTGSRSVAVEAGGTSDSVSAYVRVDSNVVTTDTLGGISVFGRIYDTVVVRGNTVNVTEGWGIFSASRRTELIEANNVSLLTTGLWGAVVSHNQGAVGWKVRAVGNQVSGGYGMNFLAYNSGIPTAPPQGTTDSIRVFRNTVTGSIGSGIYIDTLTSGSVVIDTNLVTDNAGGIYLRRPAGGTLNSIRRNANDGLVYNALGAGVLFPANNFERNRFGVRNLNPAVTVDATNSWWGDLLGPTCDSALEQCDPSSTGDSVSAYVSVSPFATDTVVGSPIGAPRFLGAPRVAAQAAPVRAPAATAVAPAGGSAEMMEDPGLLLGGEPTAVVPAPAAPALAPSVPEGGSGGPTNSLRPLERRRGRL